jgi:two-component system, OmpR family, KDP operon response regulator KdpE
VALILLVDDDPQFRRTVRLALDSNDYDVSEAADGRAALSAAAADPPDLVLLDWHLPESNGLKTCKALRADSSVPIIMMSANRSHSKQIALDAGANDFLMKPFSFLDLLKRIEAALTAGRRRKT